MQDPNTQQEQVPVIDFSTIDPNIPKLENQQEIPEIAQQETPANEFIIVDGERIEVNLNEVIGENPDGSPRFLRDTDNPKSYKYYQSKDTKKEKRIKELEDLVKTVQKPAEVKTEQKPEPPKRPVFPTRPKDYDPTEAVTNPQSESYQFERAKEDYYSQKDAYDLYVETELRSFKGQIETEKAEQLKSKEELAYQAQMLGQIQQVGGVDATEAKEIWDTYTTPKENDAFLKELVEFHHFKKGQKTPQTQQQIDNFNRNGKRQSQYIAPPGIIGSQSVPENPTLGDALMETVKKYRI